MSNLQRRELGRSLSLQGLRLGKHWQFFLRNLGVIVYGPKVVCSDFVETLGPRCFDCRVMLNLPSGGVHTDLAYSIV